MNKKNTFEIILLSLIVIIIIVLFTIIFDLKRKNENLNNEITNLEEENMKLRGELTKSNQKVEADKPIVPYTYTQTFLYLGDYEYQATVPTHKFIIVDKFQMFSPKILEINKSVVTEDMKYRHNYEITFSGNEVIKIVETDKVGLDQIQESCKGS